MFKLKSLRAKLIVCFLALTLIPLTVTALYGHFFTSRALSQQILERSTHQVHLQAESIVSGLRQAQGDALYLRALRSLNMLRQQTHAEQIELWRQEVEQDLLVLASVRPMYHAVRLLDETGMEIIGVRAEDQRVHVIRDLNDRKDTAYFTQAMSLPEDGIYVSPFQTQDTEGAPYINYAMHISDGVLVIDLHAGWLLRALPEHPSGDTWALIDHNGHFLVYPEGFDPNSIASDIPPMLTGQGGSFETTSSVYLYDTIYPDGRENGTGAPYWVVFRYTPINALYASVNDFVFLAALFIVATALVAITLALKISQVLVDPVKRLEKMTLRFGHEGRLPALPQKLPSDEIGTLTRTFIEIAHELDAKRRQERRLIERLISAQEEERKLVAYDLHDGLIQQMVGARLYLNECRDLCPKVAMNARTGLQRGCDALSEAIVEGRRIIEGLRPATLDDLGLTEAIQELAQANASAAGWELKLNLQPLSTEPEKTIAVTLYRIVQEALNNARKHANAKRVCVNLHNGDGINITVEDDGRGFDFVKVSGEEHGLGIRTMQERAGLINGKCTIQTVCGAGTRIAVNVPAVLTTNSDI
jgi:signal transduction histidine kinase